MSYINWGHETPEQKETRKRFEERELFEQALAVYARSSSSMAGAAASGKITDSSWIGQAKSKLKSRYSEATELVPNLYCFWDDYTTSDDDNPMPSINDGGDDMYDGGNYMNTNLTAIWDDIKNGDIDNDDILAAASIPYTHTQADNEDDDPNQYYNPPMDGKIENGDNYFGEESRYFTNMYPGLFVMIADNISISEFNISGNVGSDGNGSGAGYVESVVPNWTLFYKTNTDDDNSDPSINQLILVPGSAFGITQEYDDSSENDDHRITGITDRNRLVYAVVARHPDEDVLSESDAILVAQKLLEIIL
jgi:hypothetical protein